jgi:acyl-coenzyme A thioesterase PaaI-like protein
MMCQQSDGFFDQNSAMVKFGVMQNERSVQEIYSPDGICFGCGPANEKGLHIRSFVDGDELVAEWRAEPHHQAFPGVLNGGIIGALLDCHSNWAAAYHLMKKRGETEAPCTVTAEFHVKLLRPTPADALLKLRAPGRRINRRPRDGRSRADR